ncbi:MAG TPA: hypothetical protein V6D34_02545, partial [Candidatus Sericytochromatia bacterium]
MKLLQRLTQPLETRGRRARRLWKQWETRLHQITDQHFKQHPLPVARSPHTLSGQSNGSSGQPNGHVIRNVSSGTASRSSLLVAATVVVITSAIGHRFYNAPKLDVGKAAPQTIVAPASVTVEDAKATEEKRKVARREATSVLMLDQAINQQIEQAIQQQLNQANELRQLAGSFPFTKTATLSNPVQTYLRKASAQDWTEIAMAVNQATRRGKRASQELKPTALDANQQKAFAELRSHRIAVSAADYTALVDTINEARSQYQVALKSLPKLAPPETTPVFDASLLDL